MFNLEEFLGKWEELGLIFDFKGYRGDCFLLLIGFFFFFIIECIRGVCGIIENCFLFEFVVWEDECLLVDVVMVRIFIYFLSLLLLEVIKI